MEIFWPLERRYVSVEEQQASCRRRGLGCRWGFFFREGDAFPLERELQEREVPFFLLEEGAFQTGGEELLLGFFRERGG